MKCYFIFSSREEFQAARTAAALILVPAALPAMLAFLLGIRPEWISNDHSAGLHDKWNGIALAIFFASYIPIFFTNALSCTICKISKTFNAPLYLLFILLLWLSAGFIGNFIFNIDIIFFVMLGAMTLGQGVIFCVAAPVPWSREKSTRKRSSISGSAS
jgi:hypothetical protein